MINNIQQYVSNKIKYYQTFSHIKYYINLQEKYSDNQIIDILENKLIRAADDLFDLDNDKALYEICKFFDFNIDNIITFLKKMYSSQIGVNFNYQFNKNNLRYNFQDPLIYFDVGYGRCGDISRFCIDLFKAGFGFQGRLLQFKNHVSCEININGNWKLIDIDLNTNYKNNILDGIRVIKKHTINKYINMTAHNPIYYMVCKGGFGKSTVLSGYPSFFFNKFTKDKYNIIIEKNYQQIKFVKTRENMLRMKKKLDVNRNVYFWNYRNFSLLSNIKQPLPTTIFNKLCSEYSYPSDNNLLHQMLEFSNIKKINEQEFQITWIKTDIIKKYKILVSNKSRGWNYIKIYNKNIENYVNKISLQDNNFNKIYSDISCNIYNLETENDNIIIDKLNFEKLYVSIIPIDNYGYSIDREYYLPSEELII